MGQASTLMANACMLQEWGVTMLYYGRHRKQNADELGAQFEPDLDKFLAKCDVITINCPLTDKTRCYSSTRCLTAA